MGAIGCSNSEALSEKSCEENTATCMDYDDVLSNIFNDLLGDYQSCEDDADCSIKEFVLTCENGSTFSTCPVAVASRKGSDLEFSWHQQTELLCAEMRDCNMTCIARASCIAPTNDSVKCVFGRCTAE